MTTKALLTRIAPGAVTALLLLGVAGAAHAITGDLAPRGAPNGQLNLGDATLALRMARGTITPTAGEITIADVSPGSITDATTEPPTWTPTGDGAITDADAKLILDAALEAIAFPDSRSVALLSENDAAYVGVIYQNTAKLSTPFTQPAVFAFAGTPPEGMTIDPVTGVINYIPPPGVTGKVTYTVTATDGMSTAASMFELQVEQPEFEGGKFIDSNGGTIGVEDPDSPIAGASFTVGPGKLQDGDMLTLQTVSTAPAYTEDSTPLTPPVLPPQGKNFTGEVEMSFQYDPDALPPDMSPDKLSLAYLATASAEDALHEEVAPRWVLLPTTVNEETNQATAVFDGTISGVVQLFALAGDPNCPIDNTGERFQFVVSKCPTYSLEDARTALEIAAAIYEGSPFNLPLPNPITVKVEDMSPLGYVNFSAPSVLHLNRSLFPPFLRTTSAHELFHMAQRQLLGTQGANVFDYANNAYILESSAAFVEDLIWDDDNAYLLKGNRVSARYTSRSIDDPNERYRQFTLFDYLLTSNPFPPGLLFFDTDFAHAGDGARALDALLGGNLGPVYLDLVYRHDFTRDDAFLGEISTWGFTAPVVTPLSAADTGNDPLALMPLRALRHMSGRSAAFQVDAGAPADAHVFVRLTGDAPLIGDVRVPPAEGGAGLAQPVESDVPVAAFAGNGQVVDLGTLRGKLVLNVANPEFEEGAGGAVAADAYLAIPMDVVIDSPGDFTPTADAMATIAGHVDVPQGETVSEVTLSFGRASTQAPVASGMFTAEVPLEPGANTILVTATSDDGSHAGSARVTVVRTSAGSDLKVTLTWDLDNTDVDLYVTQPNSETVYYGHEVATNGAELDFDNQDGFGPENFSIDVAAGDTLLSGDYVVRLHYYVDAQGPPDRPVHWRVDVVKHAGTPSQQRQTIEGTIQVSDFEASNPGTTGPSWSSPDIVVTIP